jgi:hypothetical protein
MRGDSNPEPSLEMPVMMKRPELSLPESPLLQPQHTRSSSSEFESQLKQRVEELKVSLGSITSSKSVSQLRQWVELKKLEVNLMNGELERFKPTPPGATDPDSMWRGQMMRANSTLRESGLPALNVRRF